MTDGAEAAQDTTAHDATAAQTRARRGRGRRIRRLIMLVLVPLVLIAGAASWYAFTGRYVTSENAYVKAHIIAISTDIDGRRCRSRWQ
jgi:membrane fusion protein, multidrug efflux system